MKKPISCALVALLSCFAASTAAAQNMAAQKLSAGVQAGVSVSTLGGDQSQDNPSAKVGFAGGAFLAMDLHEYFRLRLQGQYVQKGAKFPDFNDKTKVDYIEFLLPLTLIIPVQNSPIEPRIYAGPAVSLLVNCKFTDGQSVDCKDITKNVDYGVFFGGGGDYRVGNGAVMLDVLYNLGLANANDGSDRDTFSVKNRNFQALLGYRFFFGS